MTRAPGWTANALSGGGHFPLVADSRRAFLRGLALGLLAAASLRALLSTLFYESLATLRLNETAAWTLVLLSPLAAPLLPRTRWPLAVAAAAAGALPFARFTEAFVPLAALAVAAALLGLAQLPRAGWRGALAGVAVAAGLLVAGDSADPLLAPWGALLVALLALVALPGRWRAPDEPASLVSGAAFAALVVLELAYLASPFALVRHAGLPPWAGTLASAGGLLLGATWLARAGPWLWAAGALGLVDLALAQSPLVAFSIFAVQAALGAAAARLPRPHPSAFALVLAPLAFGLLFFGALLGEREWTLVVPLLAALLLLAPVGQPRASRASPRLAAPALALLVALGAFHPPVAPPPDGGTITVVSWNVHQGFGNRGGLDAEIYADVLRRVEPDIVLLQETSNGRFSSGGLDNVRILANALGMHAAYARSSLAVLSRFPLEPNGTIPERGWSFETGLDVGGRTLWAQSVHLSRSPVERAWQAQQILADAEARPGLRILAGDLNSCPAATCFGGRPSDDIHRVLTQRYQDAWSAHHAPDDPAGSTHNARNPTRRIDVIMVEGLEVLEAYPVRDERTALGSDHLPVVARLRLPP